MQKWHSMIHKTKTIYYLTFKYLKYYQRIIILRNVVNKSSLIIKMSWSFKFIIGWEQKQLTKLYVISTILLYVKKQIWNNLNSPSQINFVLEIMSMENSTFVFEIFKEFLKIIYANIKWHFGIYSFYS